MLNVPAPRARDARKLLGASLALGLGLAGQGADHLLGQVHLLHFDHADLNAPRRRVLIENGLQPDVKLFALAQKFVELDFSEDAAPAAKWR